MSQFIESVRFIASSSSNLVNNVSDRIHRIKSKYGHDDKKSETYGIKCNVSIATVFLNIQILKMI